MLAESRGGRSLRTLEVEIKVTVPERYNVDLDLADFTLGGFQKYCK